MLTIRLSNLTIPLDQPEDALRSLCARTVGVPPDELGAIRVRRRSLDARHSSRLRRVYTVDVEAPLTPDQARKIPGARVLEETSHALLRPGSGKLSGRPTVVGAGPAGLFAAFTLAENGYRPVLIERGKPVELRRRDTTRFWKHGLLDPDSNVLFGEGGAGAFSDGKLTSRSKDPRREAVLARIARCGAGDSVCTDARPHVGTDRLYHVLREMRRQLLSLGCEIFFESRLDDLVIEGGALTGIRCSDTGLMPANALVLACGHSARDTYLGLQSRGVALESKPFALGVRVQHPQEIINRAQYGARGIPRNPEADAAGAAEYVLRCPNTREGRAVYSFCVCPGGVVIPCSSEPGTLFCNGMSGQHRAGRFANGAIVAQIPVSDFASDDPLAGIGFQKIWEKAAFEATGGTYALPMMPLSDFVKGAPPSKTATSLAKGRFPRAEIFDVSTLLPSPVVAAIREASSGFARSIPGWLDGSAVAFGVETRTSSPVRILRGADGQSVNTAGLFPAGEGAGYAGGIVSAAIDGIRAAENLIARFAPPS